MANRVETSGRERQAVLVGDFGYDLDSLQESITHIAESLRMKFSVLVFETLQDLKGANLNGGLTLAVVKGQLAENPEMGKMDHTGFDAVENLDKTRKLPPDRIILTVEEGNAILSAKDDLKPLRVVSGKSDIQRLVAEILKKVSDTSGDIDELLSQELEVDKSVIELLNECINEKRMLTVCSSCFKITKLGSDLNRTWQEIPGGILSREEFEKLLKSQSITCSDGICPCCMNKLYSEYVKVGNG